MFNLTQFNIGLAYQDKVAAGSAIGMMLRRVLILALAFFNLQIHAQSAGVTDILSGPATWIEGTFHRTLYAPGTDQTRTIDGSWHAILSDKGIQITVSRDNEEITVSKIGGDQFELHSKEMLFQEGAVRAIKNGTFVGPDVKIAQYIHQRMIEISQPTKITPSYGMSWNHFVDTLHADIDTGMCIHRIVKTNSVDDEWHVSKTYSKNSQGADVAIFPTGYSTNGFLALTYSSNTGKIESGETLRIQEYWPKSNPASDSDVYPFCNTKISISSAKPVSDINLLPVVYYNKTEIADYRFTNASSVKPMNLRFRETQWITQNSTAWKMLQQKALKIQRMRSSSTNTTNNN